VAEGQPASGAAGVGGTHRAERRRVVLAQAPTGPATAGRRRRGRRRRPARPSATTAEALGIAPGTVKAHLSQGLANLRAELTPLDKQEDS
jgi:hypothetical protein